MSSNHRIVGPNQLYLGNPNPNNYASVKNVGGQDIRFTYGSGLTSIQIGNTVYGETSGGGSAVATIPGDGRFILKKVHFVHWHEYGIITYFQADMGNLVEAGGPNEKDHFAVEFGSGITVEFDAIGYADGVIQSLTFGIIG